MSLVGFIGLGNMGGHMARNLLKNGIKVIAYDTDAKRVDYVKSHGGQAAGSPAEIAAATKEFVTMLPTGAHVVSVLTGPKGVHETIQPGSLCIDSSTIDQSTSIMLAEWATKKQSFFLDAPVSGGVVGAEKATLTFMVGGDAKAFERAKKYFDFMGKNAVHCGKPGNGLAAKICNNMLLITTMISVAETMNLGIKMGLDAKQLASIINTSTGRCWSSDTYNPVPGVMEDVPSAKGYAGGFNIQLVAKDLGLAQNASTDLGAPTPLGSLAHQFYRLLANHPEYKEKDFAAIYKYFKESV
ncbi:6-phosphogluconate dehydrogenase [Aphelenchoides avenae]|nr:6-phosphogluconate dehydrogenase [Aphelenchus avenae]